MRTGATISGALHGGLLMAVLLDPYLWAAEPPAAISLAEVTVVDGAAFDAALSAAPQPVTDTPDALNPRPGEDLPPAPEISEPAPERPPTEGVAEPEPADPSLPVLPTPPPPTTVPTEIARPSIAEVPVPEELANQAPQPESPPATEPLQPLASAEAPLPGDRPERPPEPEPEVAEEPQPEPEVVEEPTPEAETLAEVDAPLGPAPQQATLPIARPAEIAAAAPASQETRQAQQTTEAPQKAAPKPARPRIAASRFAAQVTRGEKDALRIGLKRYFTYAGNRADRSLFVRIAIGLDPSGRIVQGPELLEAGGATPAVQNALFRSGRSALIRAANGGEFAKLPIEKYDAWKVIHVTFTPTELGFGT
ncbi:MAG: hypothetical protein AAF183_03755 [Pseudomonadota bacterium]